MAGNQPIAHEVRCSAMTVAPDLPERFNEALVEAMLELLDAYGLGGRIGYVEPEFARLPMLAAATAFVGSGLKGSLTLMASRSLIAATQVMSWTEPRLRDWIGELGNQALGSISRKLQTQGLEVTMGLPAVLGAVRLDPSMIDERYTRAHAFSTRIGTLLVCLDVVAFAPTRVAWSEPPSSPEPEDWIL